MYPVKSSAYVSGKEYCMKSTGWRFTDYSHAQYTLSTGAPNINSVMKLKFNHSQGNLKSFGSTLKGENTVLPKWTKLKPAQYKFIQAQTLNLTQFFYKYKKINPIEHNLNKAKANGVVVIVLSLCWSYLVNKTFKIHRSIVKIDVDNDFGLNGTQSGHS